MKEIWNALSKFITADNVALLSVIITVMLYLFTRRAEIQYKKYDDKKVHYLKLIQLMEEMYMGMDKGKNGQVELTDEMKKLFFDTGSSLLLYGSKKIYKLYLLFREYSSNPLIKQCKYYKDNALIYIISEILATMRKEVGLSFFDNIEDNDALGFFVNDISSNPLAKKTATEAKFRIRMVKFELFILDRSQFVWLNKFYMIIFKPIFAGMSILFKYIILIPLGKLISRLFPEFATKVQKNVPENK